jgi:hypothetical protein
VRSARIRFSLLDVIFLRCLLLFGPCFLCLELGCHSLRWSMRRIHFGVVPARSSIDVPVRLARVLSVWSPVLFFPRSVSRCSSGRFRVAFPLEQALAKARTLLPAQHFNFVGSIFFHPRSVSPDSVSRSRPRPSFLCHQFGP